MAASWHWSAIGKHPVANDFINIGTQDATVRALWEWVESGFNRWVSPSRVHAPSLSFRWWAAGAHKNTLLCGILRASSDHIGRPYPLMVAGWGDLYGWRSHWNLLPFACEPSWNRMEAFAAGSQRDLQTMEQKLKYLPPPLDNWADLQALQLNGLDSGRAAPASALAKLAPAADAGSAGGDRNRGVLTVPVPRFGGGEHARVLSDYYGQWRIQNRELPSIVFMGGPMDAAQLILFLRPLKVEDFVGLWNAGATGRPD